MLFNTPLFFWFFAGFYGLFNFVFVERRKHLWLLLLSSLVFYGSWNYAFIPLLIFNAVADYIIAQRIEDSGLDDKRRKRWLVLSLVVNLGVLGIFKYSNFVLQSFADFVGVFGIDAGLPTLSIVLPVGISFYTFQSMSYTIDVYRREMKAHKGFLEFLTALSFFPQLVAGPILRARHILPQMDRMPVPTFDNIKHGLVLVVAGLIKKNLADLMAGPAAAAFDADASVSSLESWIGALAFTGQIYGDFSGYTDIAIGIALLMGFHIPLNFNLPYLSSSPVDFWRRWHISLSTWLRDYLYISLGGNRNGHRSRNVFITMLLGGLWHGAAWTFVFWGAWHGLLITVTHWFNGTVAGRWMATHDNTVIRLFKIALTFYLVVIGWVFFRATGFDNAFQMLSQMHWSAGLPEADSGSLTVLTLVAAGIFFMHLLDWTIIRFGKRLEQHNWLLWPLLVAGFVVVLLIGDPGHDFIYFQF
jgi:alginate O-acetyltransferase complex protein AlgI